MVPPNCSLLLVTVDVTLELATLMTLLELVVSVTCIASFPALSDASIVKLIAPFASLELTVYLAFQELPEPS